MRALPLFAFVMLGGCQASIVTACPAIPAYSAAFQERLADEIQALPPGSALGEAIIDYKRLRDQLRACRAA
jgi:hypothetical protein